MAPYVNFLEVTVPGPPRGYMRPSTTRSGRRYKPAKQEQYEEDVVMAWRRARSPRLVPGPYRVDCIAVFKTPKGWRLKDGSPSAEALRRPYPDVVPDLDNLIKQIDTLVGCGALPDDKMMINVRAVKMWPRNPNEHPGLTFRATTL